MGFVDNDAFNRSYTKNPFNFKNFDLRHVNIYLDGQQNQIKPLKMNFGHNEYIMAFLNLFIGSGKGLTDEGNQLDRTDFKDGYAIYAFDLTPDMSEDTHFNLLKEGNLRIDVTFGTALPNTVNAIIYFEFENVLKISRNRFILFDYSN